MNLSMCSGFAACGAGVVCLACAGTHPPAQAPQTPEEPVVSASDSTPSDMAHPQPLASGEETTAPAREPVPAAASMPAGIPAMTDAERVAMEKACKPLMEVIAKIASQDKDRWDRKEAAWHALQSPPEVAGVDMEKCTSFMRGQLAAFRAKSIETEAIINIKRIVVGLSDASVNDPPRLCPSAPPVPASLDTVRKGPHQEPPSGWNADGWRCVRFQLGGAPQRFQYELVTDPKEGTYRIIARGFPVDGYGPEELFLTGKAVDGRVEPSSEVMRK